VGVVVGYINDLNARQEEHQEMIFITEVAFPPRAGTVHALCLDCWAFLAVGLYLVGYGHAD